MLAVSPIVSKRPARVPPFNECPAKMLLERHVNGRAKTCQFEKKIKEWFSVSVVKFSGSQKCFI